MAVFMTALVSELHSHARSDPEYFLPSHTQVESDLDAVPTLSLRRLGRFSCSAFYPAATHLYSSEGIPFLRCVDIVDFPIISPDQPFARIPTDFVAAHSTIRSLRAGDIVISKVGSPCYAALLADDMPLSAMTRTVLGMSSIDQSTVDPYYLVAFLRSRHGFDQLMRERELTIQFQLTLERTRKIRVFLPDLLVQQSIGNMVRGYYKCLRDSLRAHAAAQKLLETELGLDNIAFQNSVGYTASFSDLESSRRSDAEFFHTRYEPFLNAVTSYPRGWQPLKNLTRQKVPNFDSRKASGDVFYIEIGDVDVSNGSYTANSVAVRDLPANARIELAGGEILLSQVRPTRGAIAIVDDALPNKTVCSGAFYVCTANQGSHREVIWLYLRLMRGVFEKFCGGTSYPTIDSRYLARFPVPLFDAELACEIQELVSEAKSALRESERLLEQAKARVEQLIEEAIQR
jgi:type I restriction enzyme S subunit